MDPRIDLNSWFDNERKNVGVERLFFQDPRENVDNLLECGDYARSVRPDYLVASSGSES